MKIIFSLCLMWFAFSASACSETDLVNSESVAANDTGNPSITTSPTAEEALSENSREGALSNEKPCIKKKGWLLPPPNGRLISDRLDLKVDTIPAENGKEVEVTQTSYSYGYENAWTYSQDVPCEGGDMNYLKGRVATPWYTEFRAKGKVFMYSIFAKEVRVPPPANSDSAEERFIYRIQDRDGDGIFEALVRKEKVTVPDWVLK